MEGKWSTTVSPEQSETQVITLTDVFKGPLLEGDQRQPGDHLELLLAVDLACKSKNLSGKKEWKLCSSRSHPDLREKSGCVTEELPLLSVRFF